MNRLHRLTTWWLAGTLLAGCIPVPPRRITGYLVDAELAGRTRAEVIAEIGLPSAVGSSGAFLYAIPSTWYHYNDGLLVYRIVRFDERGVVTHVTPPEETDASVAALASRLDGGPGRP